MISALEPGSLKLASISAKNGARSPVSMSSTTIGEFVVSDASGSLNDGRFVTLTPFGKIASIGPVGEKPSQRLIRLGSIEILSPFFGIASIGTSTRMPVAEVASVFVNAIEGHGNMHDWPPSGLHSSAIPVPLSPPHAAANPTTTPKIQMRRFPTERTVSLCCALYVANRTAGPDPSRSILLRCGRG